jgi:hypothetical protein
MKIFKRYSFLVVTGMIFVMSLAAHWTYSWFMYLDQQRSLNQPVVFTGYINKTMDEMAQNWQSEFLQVIWEVVGLTILRFAGSPMAKGGEERNEAILRKLLEKRLDPNEARQFLKELEQKYPKH